MKIRVGIDVGGTFTDAVAIDNNTFELIGSIKVPTTHTAEEGVAKGIADALYKLIKEYNLIPEDIHFIAHGTTQATNALLEGDVSTVGIIACSERIQKIKVKADTNIGDIEISPGKFLKTFNAMIEGETNIDRDIDEIFKTFKEEGVDAVVAVQPFSVDNPEVENKILKLAEENGFAATATNKITKLYGLRIRTRTAAINGCILPKMIQTCDRMKNAVKSSGIKAPLMIMRCDGGVMNVKDMKKRPIQSLLSGPAAGVAGALMYEKVSNGIFLEVGGTSTDISLIKNGRVMMDYAEIGGHKTYLNSLDVRTIGVAGGSMVRIREKEVIEVGPRSAHITGLPYAVYSNVEDIMDPEMIFMQPLKGDPDNYAAIRCSNGKTFALTVSCAANILGYVKPGDYAYGNAQSARKAFGALAAATGKPIEQLAEEILEKAYRNVATVIMGLANKYKMDKEEIMLISGGGGCSTLVPYIAKRMDVKFKISRNAHIISTIGVSMAMLREVVERTIYIPSDKDIHRVRIEAKDILINSGAVENTIETTIELDTSRNIIRAIATGTVDMRLRDNLLKRLNYEELLDCTARFTGLDRKNINMVDCNGNFYIFDCVSYRKYLCFMKRRVNHLLVIDAKGIIRVQKEAAKIYLVYVNIFIDCLNKAIEENTQYGDAGAEMPDCFIILPLRIVDISGFITPEQIISVANAELSGLKEDEKIIILMCRRTR